MNWDALGAIGEIISALVVAITLAYFAIQLRASREAASDANRLERAKGVREMFLATSVNSELRQTVTKGLKLGTYYYKLGQDLEMSADEAASFDWAMLYWFWLHWGQFASETRDKDVEELKNIIGALYTNPAVRNCWENSPWGKQALEPDFVSFVDEILNASDVES